MNISERITTSFLYGLDWLMNLVTSGEWGRVRGAQRPVIKIRKVV